MQYGERLVFLVDAAYAHQQREEGYRTHLGGSVIGGECMREVWFKFRWAASEEFEGRMLRLFNRGNKAEEKFAELLRGVGATVWTQDAAGKQFRIVAHGGHFGGSLDGVAVNLPDLPPEVPPGTPVLLEMKTHNDKSFKDLQKKGLIASKPKHYKQAQIYMHKMDLKWCLYCAVNKNDDTLWFWLFAYDPSIGTHLLQRAQIVIFTREAPPRISESPAWFACRFCAMRGVCHGSEMPRVNCRTCIHATAEQDGTWACAKQQPEIATQPQAGCGQHVFLPSLFAHTHVTAHSAEENYVAHVKRNGSTVVNGPTQTPSHLLDLTH